MLALAAVSVVHAATQLIVDTDMSYDVDDVAAVSIAHALADRGEVDILAIVHNTGLVEGVGAVSVINHWYNRSVPLGAYVGPFDNPDAANASDWDRTRAAGPYVRPIVAGNPSSIKNCSQVPDAVAVYRKALAAQPDASVTISSIGFLTNIAALLASGPDEYSSLSGVELVAAKVRLAAVMGGSYPSSSTWPGGREWNFGGGCGTRQCSFTPPTTKYFLDNWPPSVPLVFSGAEMGVRILTGLPLLTCTGTDNPVRQAFELYGKVAPCPPRFSWDPATTLFAIRGAGDYWDLKASGHNSVDGTTGSNEWLSTPPPGGQGKQAYLVLKADPKEVGKELNDLMCTPPKLRRARGADD